MKCGTTILYDFLSAHSKVTGAAGKEVHYFSLYFDKGVEWYLGHFDLHHDSKYLLDSSPTYFDMALEIPTAERIREFCPHAKIIILIRNPVERAVSHFAHLQRINEIGELADLSAEEFLARRWPEHRDHRALSRYHKLVTDFSRYSEKISRYAEVFGPENVMVIGNEDLRADGNQVLRCVFDFLELEPEEGVDYSEQKYLGRNSGDALSVELQIELWREFGSDYYASCRQVAVQRPLPLAASSTRFNEPAGAIIGDVAYGPGGWLYLVGGTNDPLRMYLDEPQRRSAASAWLALVRERRDRLAAMGIAFFQCMIPEKLSILGDNLGWPLDFSKSFGSQFAQTAPPDLGPCIVNLFDFFRNSGYREDLYLKTDSHWSHLGAFSAYQMLCCQLGIQARADLLRRGFTEGEVLFDLGAKLPDRPKERARFYAFRREAEIVNEHGLVAYKRRTGRLNDIGLHVGSFIHFRNEGATVAKKAVLFGDSFSEYRDHLLTGLLAETFSELIFVWSASIDYEVVRRHAPDVVICAITERFMRSVPDDRFDLDAHTRKVLETAAP
jgi:hypothetical protein